MKSVLIMTLLFSSLANAQPLVHIAAASSSRAKIMVDGGGGYRYKNFIIEGSIIASPVDQREDHPAYFSANAGYEIKLGEVLSIVPVAGAVYRMASVDKKELNGFVPQIGICLKIGNVYVGYRQMDGPMLSIGFSACISE